MSEDSQKKLEEWAQRVLEQLPSLPAPDTLIPSVLNRLRLVSSLPWYQRTWFVWPSSLRTASGLLSALILGGVVLLLSMLDFSALLRLENWKFLSDPLVGAVSDVFSAFARLLGKNFLLYALGVVLMMYLFCIALGTLCVRLISNARR